MHLAAVLALHSIGNEALELAKKALDQDPANTEILSRAVGIANRKRAHQLALDWLEKLQVLDPQNLAVQYQTGLQLIHIGEHGKALDLFNALLNQRPGDASLLLGRLTAAIAANASAEAIAGGEALVAIDPANDVCQYYFAIAKGETPPTQPREVIADDFDRFAETFDQHLVVQLKYKLPRDVAN